MLKILMWLLMLFGFTITIGGCTATHTKDFTWGFHVDAGYTIEQTGPNDGTPASAEIDIDSLTSNIIDLKGKDEG